MQGCVLYPKYHRPDVEVPDNWRFSTDEAATYANEQWWKQFNDPVLDCLIDEALQNNNDLMVAIVRVRQFVGQLDIAQSGLYPQLNGTFNPYRQKNSLDVISFPGTPQIYDLYTCLLNASYDIDIWGEIRSASDAAKADLLGSVETRRTIVLTLVTGVAISYIQLRQYDEQLKISQDTYRSRQESYKLAVDRYLGGLTSELEAKQEEAEMDEALVQVLQYRLNIAEQEDLLSVLIGHPPQSIERGLGIFAFTLPPQIPTGLPSDILEQRPDILKAEQDLISANADIGVARAQFFPSFNLTGFYGNQSLELRNFFTGLATTWQYALNVLQPLFTGWKLTGQLEVAESQKWQAYYAYQQTVLNAFQEVNDALIQHQLSKELLLTQTRRVDALTIALHLAQLQYDNGQVDYLNVLDAQRNLFVSQLDMAQAQSFIFLSLVNIYKALGGGWVIDADRQALHLETAISDCQ